MTTPATDLPVLSNTATPTRRVKPPVDPATLAHKDLLDGDFWRRIPAWADIDEATFLDHRWQAKNTITKPEKLLAILEDLAPEAFYEDAKEGFRRAPMAVRCSPYLMSLIDWDNPYEDPLRIQFIPVASRIWPDHPCLTFDSLAEQDDAPVPGLTHRYVDKALFLALDTCPVYCRFCTRSYAVGPNPEEVEKVSLKANKQRWADVFEYIASRPELEDIVISGGDSYQLRADHLREIGERLLEMPNIRRFRFATKGLAVMPQKVLTDEDWFRAVVDVAQEGRRRHKEVVLHTHFNSHREITEYTRRATARLFEEGVIVRNQSVLIRGVNDTVEDMTLLVKRLGHVNVQPYYVYQHDLVPRSEDMRTTVQTALDIEKHVRGSTAGFNTPTFVVDAPGGGGKRNAHSYEAYDRTSGISVYSAPSVKPGRLFYYYDPIDLLGDEAKARWADPSQHEAMHAEARALIPSS
jgi:lysine 2,3-aminomutase